MVSYKDNKKFHTDMELRVDRELEDAAVALPCDRAEKGREEASRRALFMC
jgi:hypothetical protein